LLLVVVAVVVVMVVGAGGGYYRGLGSDQWLLARDTPWLTGAKLAVSGPGG